MFLSQWSVRRPIAMTALIIVLVMIGITLYPRISIDLLPNMEVPMVLVRCEYQGASPTEIEVEIVKRIEDAVSSLDGIKHITSMSMEDEARIQLEFNMGTDVDVAATDIREALNRIREDLPDGANEPTIRKIDTNATTVAQVFLVGDRTQDDLYDYADDVIADRFSSVPGVGEVRVYGANEMQIHVLLDREKLTAMNLSINDVVTKLRENNVREPLGRIQFDKGEKNVTFDGDFKDFEQIKALEIGKFKDRRIYLRDVAEVKFMSREVRSKAYVNGQPAARFRIVKKGEANAIEVIKGIRQRFDSMVKNGELPTGMQLFWFTDSGAFIQASVDDAWSSIITGIILTAVLLFLFLHEPKSTFIVMVSMPISVIVTFAVMAYFNYSFNIMTLLSLGCSVGVLVTNSIVVIENIFKHLDRGGFRQRADQRRRLRAGHDDELPDRQHDGAVRRCDGRRDAGFALHQLHADADPGLRAAEAEKTARAAEKEPAPAAVHTVGRRLRLALPQIRPQHRVDRPLSEDPDRGGAGPFPGGAFSGRAAGRALLPALLRPGGDPDQIRISDQLQSRYHKPADPGSGRPSEKIRLHPRHVDLGRRFGRRQRTGQFSRVYRADHIAHHR